MCSAARTVTPAVPQIYGDGGFIQADVGRAELRVVVVPARTHPLGHAVMLVGRTRMPSQPGWSGRRLRLVAG